jgi:FSR family fosmidomycin resistance protein-like MFS transporter
VPRVERLQEQHESAGGVRALIPYAKPLTLLYLIVVLRTMTAATFATFTPIMLVRRGLSVAQAGTVAAIYFAAVGAGGFFGGPLADRLGARRVIVLSLLLAVPFLFAAPWLSGPAFIAVVAAGGFLLQSTLPVNVTFGQALAPISAATVSSLMMGFAWGMSGLSVPFTGMLADRIGIERTMMVMALVPVVAAALALPLPRGKHTHTRRLALETAIPEVTGTDVAE